jgi:hypothetical protein
MNVEKFDTGLSTAAGPDACTRIQLESDLPIERTMLLTKQRLRAI